MIELESAYHFASMLYEQQSYAEAELICSRILDNDPENLDALCLMGAISYRLKNSRLIPSSAPEQYHLWYYNNLVWKTTRWAGVHTAKSPMDMWNYQEIIHQLRPTLIVEFGTAAGGATLFFAHLIKQFKLNAKILTVDIDSQSVDRLLQEEPLIEQMCCSSADPLVAQRIARLRQECPGPAFVILDSDHTKQHVFAELELLRPLLMRGDYLIVEDSNINGHPVLPGWGDGPFEATQEYFARYPDDYSQDEEREGKFGFSFATRGFLVRN